MMKKIRHAALAIGVFTAVTVGILWLTRGFAGQGPGETAHKAEEGKEEHGEGDGHGHAKAADACCPGEAKEPAAATAAGPDLKQIEAKKCEHGIAQVECDECRYELGVVKVQKGVTDALTKTAVVQAGELAQTLRLTGEVQFDRTRLVEVLPITPGKVVAVKALLGQRVSQGEVLAVIHSGEFGEAKAAYLEAVAAADIAAKEKERQLAVSTALERLLETLAKGQPFPEGGNSPLGEWRSRLVGASARLQQAKAVFEREKGLLAKQASSKAELETAEREFQTAQADFSGLTEEVQLNLKLDRLKAENAARLAEAKVNAADQRLHLLGLDEQAIRAVSQGKENGRFAQLEIKAPRAGVVTAQNATEGKFVETTQSLFTVADTSNLWVWCDLYERDLGVLHGHISAGRPVKAAVRVSAFPDAFTGTVDLIGSEVNEATRTVKLRVQVKNDQGRLKPGMFAAVDVELPTGKTVAIVPRNAVLNDEGKSFAFRHWKEDLWLKRDVVTGRTQDGKVEILRGLEPGERVVCGGAFLFKSDILRAKMGAGCAD